MEAIWKDFCLIWLSGCFDMYLAYSERSRKLKFSSLAPTACMVQVFISTDLPTKSPQTLPLSNFLFISIGFALGRLHLEQKVQ